MAGKGPSAATSRTKEPPLESMHVTNFRYSEKPYPMVECTVPGLSQEAFDRDWNPKAMSLMWIDGLTRMYAVNRPLSVEKRSLKSQKHCDVKIKTCSTNDDTSSKLIGQYNERIDTDISSSCVERLRSTDQDCPRPTAIWSQEEKETAFLNWPRIAKDLVGYVACTEFTMSRALYDPDVPKWELEFRLTLGHIGACSIANIAEFYDRDSTLLWTNRYQLVMVDKEKRQPTRSPAWFVDKYQGRGCMKQGLVFRPFKRPDITYCHRIQVQWSETDVYGHANYANYPKWATDALHAALLSSRNSSNNSNISSSNINATSTNKATAPRSASSSSSLSSSSLSPSMTRRQQLHTLSKATVSNRVDALCGITEETVARGLAKSQVTHYRECLEGEQVEVHVWQDKSAADPGLVWCSLTKQQEEVCQVKLWYFTEP